MKRALFDFTMPGKMILFTICIILITFIGSSRVEAGEQMYQEISAAAREGNHDFLLELVNSGRAIDWSIAQETEFEGNLRFLEVEGLKTNGDITGIYLVRKLDGTLFILSVPTGNGFGSTELEGIYKGLPELLGDKLLFHSLIAEAAVDGENYPFIRFLEQPQQLLLDRVFKISIMFMFFFVMLGMGLTLTVNDFVMVVKKPKAILVGLLMQWLLMPLLALGAAYFLGFYHNFPFIYAGLVLICACPGGVTSNLMTFYAKGDLALSVSLTSLSTVLALFFTPFILALFCSNIPDINIPVSLIMQTIIGLVLVPLTIGMIIRKKWEAFAQKATPYFSALGVFALITVITVGLITNSEKFADTERYSFMFYVMVVSLSLLGMLMAALLPRLVQIINYQARALSMEVGLRNSTLAVTIALLIQDLMGDFYSSMFVTTAIYGISMYITGFIIIMLYRKILPLDSNVHQSK